MDVIIFSGQSNMQGETEARPAAAPIEGAYEYVFRGNSLEPLCHPVGENLGYDETHHSRLLLGQAHCKRGSLVPAFCREYVKARGETAAIHAALGSTVIEQWQPGCDRYNLLVEKCKAGIELVSNSHTLGNIYFVWLQGESDGIIHTSKQSYLEQLICLKNALKRDLGIKYFGIIKVGRFYSLDSGFKTPPLEERRHYEEAILEAQEQAVKDDRDFLMLTRITEKLTESPEYLNPFVPGHYNNAGMVILGKAAAEGLISQTQNQ